MTATQVTTIGEAVNAAMTPWLVCAVVVVGLAVGSFLNVVVWRVPQGLSIVRPRSACPGCGHPIRARDNIPVVSWLALRGRCRDCREPISARYPLVEAGTAALFGLTAWRFGYAWDLLPFLWLAGAAVALALIDLDHTRLPDVIVLPTGMVGALAFAAIAVAGGEGAALGRAAIGAAACLAFYFVLLVVQPAGMGFGDVKLAGVLGLFLGWLGWGALVVGTFAAFLLGGLFALGLLLVGRAGRKTKVPFGPWMLLGAGVGIAAGEGLWEAYLSTFA